jgi:YidC/Oxa1 family membrane protein insertase
LPIWDQFVQLLEESLKLINQWVGNPGVAIIIFTLIVKALTLPLTLKSIKSMRETQRIQPLIKEVNKRFKDDKAKQQAETMRLYQEHGVNPMGSCLPMVLQIPIFLALYNALITLVQHDPKFASSFLWVHDLSKADPLFIWPVLSGAFQFIGNRMAQPYGSNKNADPQQAMMNKIMQFMPIYLIVIYLNFASGAVIYWTFSAIFSAVQTYFINGFGTLPDVPGLSWLPKRPLPPPTPEVLEELAKIDARADAEKPGRSPAAASGQATTDQAAAYRQAAARRAATPANGAPRKKSFMEKMMEQALAAQEAQQAAAAARANGTVIDAETRPLAPDTAPPAAEKPTDGRGFAIREDGDTTATATPTGATLPRKRKSKR